MLILYHAFHRAENSQTTRHLAEFHMIEPEMAFSDLSGAMDNAESFVKHVVKYTLGNCKTDINFFEKFVDPNTRSKLGALVDKPFTRIPYREAIKLLQEEIAKNTTAWQYPEVFEAVVYLSSPKNRYS